MDDIFWQILNKEHVHIEISLYKPTKEMWGDIQNLLIEKGVAYDVYVLNGREQFFKLKILEENKEEYIIPLKITHPEITTDKIGSEGFPDLLAEFSTNYNPGAKDRTTNLRLASNKINNTVVLPGETFSYNKVVGKRTTEDSADL